MNHSGFMLDLDGTVYKGGELIPGAVGFIEALKDRGIPFVFLTNNSSEPRRYYVGKLRAMGFDISDENVITSNIATIRYVSEHRRGSKVYPIASPEVIEEIAVAGIAVSDDDPDIVYLTFDRTVDYDKINRGYHHILAGAELIATHPDDLCPTEDSYDVDIGPFIRLFESLTGCQAAIIGKPNRLMLEMAAEEMGIPCEDAVMVGDRLYTDMKMAHEAGIASILVLSGETALGDLEGTDIKPTHVVASVADIPELLSVL